MKCLEHFHTEESACECRVRLEANGIRTHIVVDPLASRYPALSDIQEVAILVEDDELEHARRCISHSHKKEVGRVS